MMPATPMMIGRIFAHLEEFFGMRRKHLTIAYGFGITRIYAPKRYYEIMRHLTLNHFTDGVGMGSPVTDPRGMNDTDAHILIYWRNCRHCDRDFTAHVPAGGQCLFLPTRYVEKTCYPPASS